LGCNFNMQITQSAFCLEMHGFCALIMKLVYLI
jgi:hypothetical protein